jgi:hypothetical protein
MTVNKRSLPEENNEAKENKKVKSKGEKEGKEEESQLRVSTRLKNKVVFETPKWQDWYDNFDAVVTSPKESENKTASCSAKLWYGEGATDFTEGNTGKGNGHAEMDALHKFIPIMTSEKKEFKDYEGKLKIQCEGKPCCAQCSAILGALNIQPKRTENMTKKTYMPMTAGGTWGLSIETRKLVSREKNIADQEIADFSQRDTGRLQRLGIGQKQKR